MIFFNNKNKKGQNILWYNMVKGFRGFGAKNEDVISIQVGAQKSLSNFTEAFFLRFGAYRYQLLSHHFFAINYFSISN